MRIDIISVVPEMLDGFLNTSILARAQKKGLVEIHVHNLRDYTTDKHRRVDDYPYGGFAGMVMQCQPIDDCIAALKAERDYDEVIFTSPDGEKFDQPMANSLSMKGNLIILCGHYKGIDYRIREHLITKEVSIGDFVLTGGELAAACMTPSCASFPVPSATNRAHSATPSKTTCWLLPSTRARPTTKVGKCPMCSSRATTRRSTNGRWRNRSSARNDSAPICSKNKGSARVCAVPLFRAPRN